MPEIRLLEENERGKAKNYGKKLFRKMPAHLLIGTFAPGFARKTAMASL